MENFIIKYRDIEDNMSPTIASVQTEKPSQIIQALKEVDCIDIEGRLYEYVSTEYRVPMSGHEAEIVHVFLCEI